MKHETINHKFEDVYIRNYSRLIRFAKEYVSYQEDAENIVQDVFVDSYQNWNKMSALKNIDGYLLISVKNRSLDYLKRRINRRKITNKLQNEYIHTIRTNYQALSYFNISISTTVDLYDVIMDAINDLPEKCRLIFLKNKIEGVTQKDIAKELGLSINTVEAQMAIAYKKLRDYLAHYSHIIPLYMLLYVNCLFFL